MEDVYLIVNIIQWSLVGFFVLINLFIGFRRGTKKSLYYTLVSLFLTFVLLFAISFVTIKIYFKSPEQLLKFIENYITLSDDVKEYFVNPDISPIIFALIDVVVKIIVFIILYPIVKFILTRLIFKPIWKKNFEKNSKTKQAIIVNNKLYLNPKKGKRTFIDRIGGGLLGSIRGFVVAILILLPVIVITGSIGEGTTNKNNQTSVSNSSENEEINKAIEQLTKINNGGVGVVTKNLKFGEKTIDEILFDFAFGSSKVKIKDETYKFKLSEELNSFVGSANLLYQGGYLDSSFDYGKINYQDNYTDLDKVLTSIGKSRLLNIVLPVGIDILNDKGVLKDKLGYNPMEIEHTRKAIEAFKKMDWKNETSLLSSIVENALLVSNVDGLLELVNKPNLILSIDQSDRQTIIKVLDNLAELNTLVLSNVFIEAVINNESFLEKIKWSDNPKQYLEDRLEFILDDINFFRGEKGEISNVTTLLKAIFADEFSDFDYSTFIKNNQLNIDTLLDNEGSQIVSSALLNISNIQTIFKLIPIGTDAYLSNSDNENINELSDKILEITNNINYEQEITNIDDIYKEILKLGLNTYTNDQETTLKIVDDILSQTKNIDILKKIVNNIFEGSQLVNDVLEVLAEPLINKLVKDEGVKEFALKVINHEDFKYGTEVSNLLTIVDTLYKKTNITTIKKGIDDKDLFLILDSLGSFDDVEFSELKDQVLNLQTFDAAPKEFMILLKNMSKSEDLIVPEDFDSLGLKNDLNRILSLGYELALPVFQNRITKANYKNQNLTDILNYERINNILEFAKEKDENSVLLHSIVNYLKIEDKIKIGKYGYLETPNEYLTYDANSDEWINEINNLVIGVVDIANDFSSYSDLNLTFNNLDNLSFLELIKVADIKKYQDSNITNATFGRLFSSNLLKHNVIKVAKYEINNNNSLPKIDLSKTTYNNEYFTTDNLIELVSLTTTLINKTVISEQSTVVTTLKQLTRERALRIFNELDDATVTRVGMNKIINNVFRESLTNEQSKEFAYTKINAIKLPTGQNTFSPGLLDFNKSVDEKGKIKEDTLVNLLMFVKELQLPSKIFTSKSGEILNILDERFTQSAYEKMDKVELLYELVANFVNNDAFYILGEFYFNKVLETLSKEIPLSSTYQTYHDTLLNSMFNTDKSFNKAELNALIEAVTTVNTNKFTGKGFVLVNNITEELLRDSNDNEKVIDIMLKSKTIYNVLDSVLNTKNNESLNNDLSVLMNKSIPSINLDASDQIFKYDENVFENEKIKKEEIIKLISSVNALKVETKLNLNVFVNSVDSNINEEGKDDFDRMYQSLILQSVFSNLLKNEKITNELVNKVNDAQAIIQLTANELTITNEAYNENLLKELEVKKLLKGIKLLEIEKFDSSSMSPEKFTNLLGRNKIEETDDLDRVLDSVIIHSYIDKLVKSDSIGKVYAKLVNEIFNKDYEIIDVKPFERELDNTGKFKKLEIRGLLNSIKMLEIKDLSNANQIKLEKIVALNDEELNEFLASNYLNMLFSRFLTSNTIKTTIATSGKFNVNDFDLEIVEKNDIYDDITKTETINILKALNLLGINDFNNITISNQLLKSLTEEKLNKVLDSNYFYQVIDLTLKAQYNDIPAKAIEEDGKYIGYIKKSEIQSLIQALVILEIDNIEGGTIDVKDVNTTKLRNLYNLDSRIIDRVTSKAIITALGNDVPNNVKDGEDIERVEIEKLIQALDILELSNIGNQSINVDDVEVSKLRNLHNLESKIIDRITSKAIIAALDTDVPSSVRNDNDIEREELNRLISSLEKMDETSNPTVKSLTTLEPNSTDINTIKAVFNEESVIIHRLVSKALIASMLETDSSLDTTNNDFVVEIEVVRLFDAANAIDDVSTIEQLIAKLSGGTMSQAELLQIYANQQGENSSKILYETVRKKLSEMGYPII